MSRGPGQGNGRSRGTQMNSQSSLGQTGLLREVPGRGEHLEGVLQTEAKAQGEPFEDPPMVHSEGAKYWGRGAGAEI